MRQGDAGYMQMLCPSYESLASEDLSIMGTPRTNPHAQERCLRVKREWHPLTDENYR